MVAQKSLRSQLSRLRLHFWVFGRAEVRELRKILKPGEVIVHCAHGYYHGGSGLLVATNDRLLLIDKRPFYLNLEELKYHTIRDVSVKRHFLSATIRIRSGYKNLHFRSISDARIVMISDYVNDEIEVARRRFAKALSQSKLPRGTKDYQNPAWSPHNPVTIRRVRPKKFYAPNELAPSGQ